jgi:hypothetical protein
MLLDQVTDAQMQAGGLVMGATMAAFLGAAWVPRYGRAIRAAVVVIYLAAVLGFLLYFLM